MKWDRVIGYAMLFMGFVAIAAVLFGLTALAADQPMDRTIGPVTESGIDLSDHAMSTQR